ncbi:MAG: tRNA epoxyqueuosine(34) reductase QueG [Leptospiraceae bacterium]|nr:tRNA epoxyqueuosine(34) reductase QueG [Leptospiraceae bacterium]MDW7976254.1 tRNA epoxyqueuosine(34) reductase QueG [Leptospiraceae bacterium]
MSSLLQRKIQTLREYAKELGFDLFGITRPNLNELEYQNLKSFIENKHYLNMTWFEKTKQIRLNPQEILPHSQSVIVLGHIYKNKTYNQIQNQKVKISRYAIGKDYHKVLKKKLKKLESKIKELFDDIQTRITIDSAPVPEKLLAIHAGIGWQGKNTNIIHPNYGSFFFISCIFLDKDLTIYEESKEIPDFCLNCKLCILSCPTQALEPYKLDVSKCISYWNIESREVIPDHIAKKSRGWIFGCDICQEVCPHNRKKSVETKETNEKDFFLREEVKKIITSIPTKEEWENLKNSPLKRVPYEIFVANYKKILDLSDSDDENLTHPRRSKV